MLYLLLIVYGLLFTNVSILHQNMPDPILKKKIYLFIIKILFLLLCNIYPIGFHGMEGKTVS